MLAPRQLNLSEKPPSSLPRLLAGCSCYSVCQNPQLGYGTYANPGNVSGVVGACLESVTEKAPQQSSAKGLLPSTLTVVISALLALAVLVGHPL